jgi:hypothetical protein
MRAGLGLSTVAISLVHFSFQSAPFFMNFKLFLEIAESLFLQSNIW